MPTNEKELNNYLFDQLTILERLEKIAKKHDDQEMLEAIDFEKMVIKRKLYQKPPLTQE